jgi:hypothetical protein
MDQRDCLEAMNETGGVSQTGGRLRGLSRGSSRIERFWFLWRPRGLGLYHGGQTMCAL